MHGAAFIHRERHPKLMAGGRLDPEDVVQKERQRSFRIECLTREGRMCLKGFDGWHPVQAAKAQSLSIGHA